MPRLSDEVIINALILGIAIFILSVLLASVVLIEHDEHRQNDEPASVYTEVAFNGAISEDFPRS